MSRLRWQSQQGASLPPLLSTEPCRPPVSLSSAPSSTASLRLGLLLEVDDDATLSLLLLLLSPNPDNGIVSPDGPAAALDDAMVVVNDDEKEDEDGLALVDIKDSLTDNEDADDKDDKDEEDDDSTTSRCDPSDNDDAPMDPANTTNDEEDDIDDVAAPSDGTPVIVVVDRLDKEDPVLNGNEELSPLLGVTLIDGDVVSSVKCPSSSSSSSLSKVGADVGLVEATITFRCFLVVGLFNKKEEKEEVPPVVMPRFFCLSRQ